MVAGVMMWLTRTVVALDEAGKQARARADFEEKVRLALWRMDSTMSVVIGLENARPIAAYKSLTKQGGGAGNHPGATQNPAGPQLSNSASYINLHFQFDPSGRLSPSVLNKAADGKQAKARLEKLAQSVSKQKLLASIKYETVQYEKRRKLIEKKTSATKLASLAEDKSAKVNLKLSAKPLPSPAPANINVAQVDDNLAAQQSLSDQELVQRQMLIYASNVMNAPPQTHQEKTKSESKGILGFSSLRSRKRSVTPADEKTNEQNQEAPAKKNQPAVEAPADVPPTPATAIPEPAYETVFVDEAVSASANLELMHPLWLDSELFFARRVEVNEKEYVQGAWMNWPAVKEMLLARVRDLLPNAELIPAPDENRGNNIRLLAAIPARLDPGSMPHASTKSSGLLHIFLTMAWAGFILAAVAIGGLLFGSMKLSERRGAFVSAVTHELRTPLTTFRMYTEMLAEGMVQGEDGKKKYINTLHGEAQRLGHLVDNVLTYAQIEKRNIAERIEPVAITRLLERIRPRIAERAAQADMQLDVEVQDDAGAMEILADQSAVERILFNLVDNASKYASASADKRIAVEVGLAGRQAVFRVRDFGPGISKQSAKRLFQPFSKSAEQAAESAPGVGLGLSICRRLARQMRGDLYLDHSTAPGACFVLTLPFVASK